MSDLAQHLESGFEALSAALAPLHKTPEDVRDIPLYEFAFSYAELMAASVLDSTSAPFATRTTSNALSASALASIFGAQVLQNLSEQLARHASEVDLSTETQAFVHRHLNPKRVVSAAANIGLQHSNLSLGELSEEQRLIRDSVRQFADRDVAPLAEQIHRNDQLIPEDILAGVRRLGCFGLSVPSAYGGLKADQAEDSVSMVIATEELSRASLGAAGSLITRPEIMVRALLEGGTETQRRRWLPTLARGDKLCAVSVTEPATGSDVAAVQLKAIKTDGGWLLRGAKTWCTFAGRAELILVLARTDQNATPPHRGLSLFVVEKPATEDQQFSIESPGGGKVTGSAIPTLGYRGMHSFEMFYDDYFVADDCLIGGEEGVNRGFYFTMRGFSGGRLQTAARALGLMRAAFEAALRYAEQREIFQSTVAQLPLTRAKFLKMVTYITAIRQFAFHVANLMDRGEGQLEASLVKLIACRYAEWVTREAMQIHGGLGYAEESAVSRYFVDARVLSIFEGAEETLALRVVGRHLLDRRDAGLHAPFMSKRR